MNNLWRTVSLANDWCLKIRHWWIPLLAKITLVDVELSPDGVYKCLKSRNRISNRFICYQKQFQYLEKPTSWLTLGSKCVTFNVCLEVNDTIDMTLLASFKRFKQKVSKNRFWIGFVLKTCASRFLVTVFQHLYSINWASICLKNMISA